MLKEKLLEDLKESMKEKNTIRKNRFTIIPRSIIINKEIEILNEYLPKQLTQEELEQKIKEIIAEVGATSIKDIGVVMKTAKEKIGATADGKAINETAKKILG